ncbi:MAG: hypothetical protein JRJ35_11255 [Deltaproteobacteria bacterium]|nr:hypothetical protein [Deltaproteobacteria bacterium]MBW1924040.1 hypothetical protein [Deltaproteobacteria bacterium]
MDENGEAILVPSLVCHADILGWSAQTREAIKSGNGHEFLRRIHKTLRAAYARLREQAAPVMQNDPPEFNIKTFTDNLVVAFPSLGSRLAGEPELMSMFWVFRNLQAELARNGFLLRGAVAFGNHYMDEDFALGDALLEAVENEKAGGPPRIVLGPSIVRLVKKHITFYSGKVRMSPHFHNLLMDTDGHLFLDYLSNAFAAFPDEPIFFDLLESHRQVINNGLVKHSRNSDVLKKYQWLAGYHNFVCKHFVNENPLPWEPDEWDYSIAEEVQRVREFVVDPHEDFPYPTHLEDWWHRNCCESQV